MKPVSYLCIQLIATETMIMQENILKLIRRSFLATDPDKSEDFRKRQRAMRVVDMYGRE